MVSWQINKPGSQVFKQLFALVLMVLVIGFQGGGVYAISQSALDAINGNHPFYLPCSAAPTSSTGTTTSVNGNNITYKDSATGRSTVATIYAPSGSGTYPVIMFAPGFSAKVSEYDTYLKDVSAAGFIVVGTDFSDNASASGASAHGNDVVDMKFVIGKILAEPTLSGKINADAGVGMMGHSDGTFVTSGAVDDSRVKAYAILNGGTASTSKPLLLVYGKPDPGNNLQSEYEGSSSSYTALLTINGGEHYHYLQVHGDPAAFKPTLEKPAANTTATFFKRFLKKDAGADISKAAGSVAGVTFAQKGTATPTGSDSGSSSGSIGSSSNPSSASVSDVYILGDSITVRSQDAYKTAFKNTNISVDIDGSSSRSLGGPGIDGNKLTGMQAISQDIAQIQKAGAIVVALGTNGGNTPDSVDKAVKAIRQSNSSAPIYWVDTIGVNGANFTAAPTKAANDAIYGETSKDAGFTPVSWFKTVDPKGDPQNPSTPETDLSNYIDNSDGLGVHPTPAGQKALAALVVGAVTKGSGSGSQASASVCCGPSSTSGSVQLSGSENEEKIWNFFIGKGMKDFQVAGMLGNMQSESHFEPRLVQYGDKNSRGEISVPGQPSSLDDTPPDGAGTGYGIVQWTPATKIVPSAQKAGMKPSDLGFQVQLLWAQLTGDPFADGISEKGAGDALLASTDVTSAAQAFESKYERHRGGVQADRVSQAQAILLQYGGGRSSATATTSSPVDSSGCGGGSSSTGISAGNIIKTAMGLAWDTSKNSKDATDAYKAAWEQYDKASNTTDCGAFIATIMISSGVDTSYPKVGTGEQSTYVKNHPEKYTIINNPTSTSQLQPGDILIEDDGSGSNGHTTIYTGDQGFPGYTNIEASLSSHTPEASNSTSWMFGKPNLIAARLK